MMRELFPAMRRKDRVELVNHLEAHEVNTHIGASWELAVLWSLNKNLRAKPYLVSSNTSKKPDAEVDIGLERPIAIEIKSLSRDVFSFRKYLENAHKSLVSLWLDVSRGQGSGIQARYHEWRNYRGIRRHPSVIADPGTSNELRRILSEFSASDQTSITVNVRGIVWATIRKSRITENLFDFSCDIPSVIQDVNNSQSKNAIERASEQLLQFQDTHYMGVVLCDGGNSMFSRPNRFVGLGTPKAADMYAQIVEAADIDFAISVGVDEGSKSPAGPLVSFTSWRGDERHIVAHMFAHHSLPSGVADLIGSELSKAIESIPLPRLLPYQSRGNLEDRRRRRIRSRTYASPKQSWSTDRGHAVHISSKALLEYLRGEMSASDFERHSEGLRKFGAKCKISGIRIDKSNHTFDDDYIVIELEDDDTEKSLKEINKEI